MSKKSKTIGIITTLGLSLETFALPIINELINKKYNLVAISSGFSNEFQNKFENKIKIVDLKMNRGFSFSDYLFAPQRLKRIIKKERIDAVLYATPNASFYASKAARQLDNRILMHWGFRYIGIKNILLRFICKKIEKNTFKKSTFIIMGSKKNLELAVNNKFAHPSKMVLPWVGGVCGVDAQEIINALSLPNNNNCLWAKTDFVFGYVGRLCEDKGTIELLEAFHIFRTMHPTSNVFLVMVGKEEPKTNKLKRLINESKNNDRIIFLGFKEHMETLKIMSTFSTLIHPTHRENFGGTIIEAMFLGVPCITTTAIGASESLRNGIDGIVVNTGNINELVNAMTTMYFNEKLRTFFSNNSKEYALKNYDSKICVKKYVDSIIKGLES